MAHGLLPDAGVKTLTDLTAQLSTLARTANQFNGTQWWLREVHNKWVLALLCIFLIFKDCYYPKHDKSQSHHQTNVSPTGSLCLPQLATTHFH